MESSVLNKTEIAKLMRQTEALTIRQTVALEKIGNCLATISECLLHVIDQDDHSLRMKDIEGAKVYKTHLGKSLRSKK